MAKTLQEILRARQGNASINAFAGQIGLPVPTLNALLNGERAAGVTTLRRIYKAFPNDNEMQATIIAYVFGEDTQPAPAPTAA